MTISRRQPTAKSMNKPSLALALSIHKRARGQKFAPMRSEPQEPIYTETAELAPEAQDVEESPQPADPVANIIRKLQRQRATNDNI